MSAEYADEYDLQDAVAERLRDAFGADAVQSEVHLPSGRVCDFVVSLPVLGLQLAIEVEHNSDPGEVAADAIHGAGQALLYAVELENAVPVVVVNPTDQDRADLDALRQRMPVIEWSTK